MVKTEILFQCFTESVKHIDLAKCASRAEIGSSDYIKLKALKRVHLGSSLTCATNELTSSNHKKNCTKTKTIQLSYRIFAIYFLYLDKRLRFRRINPREFFLSKHRKKSFCCATSIIETKFETLISANTADNAEYKFSRQQENERSLEDIKPICITKILNVEKLRFSVGTTSPLKTHFFNIYQQFSLSIIAKTSQIARIAFTSYLFQNLKTRAQNLLNEMRCSYVIPSLTALPR